MTPENLDVIGLADDELEAAVCVFHVRRGRVVGRRAFIVDKVEDLSGPRLIGRVLEQVYGDSAARGGVSLPRGRAGPGRRPSGTTHRTTRAGRRVRATRGSGGSRGTGARSAAPGARPRAPGGARRSTRRSWRRSGAGRSLSRCRCEEGARPCSRPWRETPQRS